MFAVPAAREDRLILEILRAGGDDSPPGWLLEDLDWERVERRSIAAGVLPLVHWRLQPYGVPKGEVGARMQQFTVGVAMQWMALAAAAERIAAALDSAGIPLIVLKGGALAPSVYPYPSLRIVGDLDLLLPEERLGDAAGALAELGFRAGEEPGRAASEGHHHLPELIDAANNRVELHRHIVPGRLQERIPAERLFEDAQPLALARSRALRLSAERLVLHAALHASEGHSFIGMLYQLVDIAWIGRTLEVDWAAVERDAREFGVETPVYFSLAAARELVGAELPTELLDALRPASRRVRGLVEGAAAELCFGAAEWGPWRLLAVERACAQAFETPSAARLPGPVLEALWRRAWQGVGRRLGDSSGR